MRASSAAATSAGDEERRTKLPFPSYARCLDLSMRGNPNWAPASRMDAASESTEVDVVGVAVMGRKGATGIPLAARKTFWAYLSWITRITAGAGKTLTPLPERPPVVLNSRATASSAATSTCSISIVSTSTWCASSRILASFVKAPSRCRRGVAAEALAKGIRCGWETCLAGAATSGSSTTMGNPSGEAACRSIRPSWPPPAQKVSPARARSHGALAVPGPHPGAPSPTAGLPKMHFRQLAPGLRWRGVLTKDSNDLIHRSGRGAVEAEGREHFIFSSSDRMEEFRN